MYNKRINRLRKEIEKHKVDALLVSDRINVGYLTGFNGTYGFLLVNSSSVYLFTDSRYYQRCRRETTGVKVRLVKSGWRLPYKPKRLGFEACSVDYNTYSEWRRRFDGIRLVPTRYLLERLRMIKEPDELKAVRGAIRITQNVVNRVRRQLRIGITELDLVKKIGSWIRSFPDAEPAFPPIVAFGVRASMPHAGLSLAEKKLRNNQLVLIDLGTKFRGYSSDLTRTFWVGRITRKFKEIYNIVLLAQRLAINKVAPGRSVSEVDKIARNYIKSQGYGRYFGHPVGHGIGIAVHEIPRIGSKNRHKLKPGMVFSVEPGIYIPGWGGIRIEDMVLVTDKGCEVLTSAPKDLEWLVQTN